MGSYTPPQATSVVIWDTEYTCWNDSKPTRFQGIGHHREVFQYAAIKLYKGEPWHKAETFTCLAKTVFNPLSDFAQHLTGVTQRQLDEEGVTTAEALAKLQEFIGSDMAWSNGNDINPVAETCGLQKVVLPLNVIRMRNVRPQLYTALKAVVGEFNIGDYPSGRVHELLNIPLKTKQVHNAMHDVYSLAATAAELEKRGHNLHLWDEGIDTPSKD